MIDRQIAQELSILLDEYPVVTILGPRQAGKTTLARGALPAYAYSNLEVLETRDLAEEDPKAYLGQFTGPVIIDEIQRVPSLLSYIQARVDDEKQNGQFVLTGSHQLQLREAVSQSLAGRTAVLHLLPFSITELEAAGISFDHFADYCFTGFLPRIYDEDLRPTVAYSNYYQTYVERDVRQLVNLRDATPFEAMLKLLAGRAGQLMDCSSLANDVGVDGKTIRHWLSVLEASFIIFRLPPYFENFNKRITKAPKYYFTDVGLLCFLLGIRAAEQVARDPLVGQIFENLVVMECLKARYNRGQMADLYFFRDSNKNEVDLLCPRGRGLLAIEIKSAQTFSSAQLKGLRTFQRIANQLEEACLIYSGDSISLSDGLRALFFKETDSLFSAP